MKVRVKIKDPVLRSYLPGLFEKRNDGFAVNMDSFTGTVICSLVSVSDYPVFEQDDPDAVLFYLPHSRYTDSLRNKCLYVTPEAQAKINAVLKREFDTNFLSFCTESRIQGFQLRDIIVMFIEENGIEIFDGNIETLKKRYYRRELELLKKMKRKMSLMAYSAFRRTVRTDRDFGSPGK